MTADVKFRLAVTGTPEVNAAMAGVERRMDDMARATKSVGAAFIGLGIGLPVLRSMLSGAIAAADAITTLNNRLTLATGSAQAGAIAFNELYVAAQSSRTSFAELGSVYATMARAGFANMTVVKAIGDAMAISGGSAQGMQAALTQLGQGMAAGVLRGEELNSVMEQAPRLAMALADGLGVPIGKLRELGQAGELTAEKVVKALEKSAPQLAQEVTKSAVTVSQGMTVLGNATTRLIGNLDQAVSGSKTLASALTGLASALDAVGTVVSNNQAVISALFAGVASVAVVAGLKAVVAGIAAVGTAVTGLSAVLAANPVVLAILGVAAVAGVGYGIYAARARELETYTGKVERLAQIEKQLEKNRLQGFGERSIYGGDGENVALRAERDRLKSEIEQRKTELSDQVRRSEAGILAKEAAAEQAVADARKKIMGQYATDAEKLADALREAEKAWGGALPADLEQRIRDKFIKPSKEAQSQSAEFIKALQKQKQELDAEVATFGQSEAAQLSYKASKLGVAASARELIKAIDEQQRALMRQRATQAEIAAYNERAIDDDEARRVAIEQAIAGVRKSIEGVRDETEALKGNNVERQVSIALRELESRGISATSEQYQEMAKRLRDAIVERDDLKKSTEAWEQESIRIRRINDQIGQSLADALMNGGKSAAEYIKGLFRSMVLRPALDAIVKPFAGAVGGLFGVGGSGSAFAGSGGGFGISSLSDLGSLAKMLGGGNSALIGGAQNAILNLGDYLATSQSDIAATVGEFLQGNSAALGTAGAYLGGGMAGIFAGRAISGGYSALGSSGNTSVNAGAIAGAVLGGPIGAAIGGAVGGLVNRAFGRKLADTGIEGSFGGGDFSGSSYEFYKGGWFRSNKTKRGELDGLLEQALDAGALAAKTQAEAYAKALGLPVEAVQNYTQALKISFQGLDENGQKAAIEKAVNDYQDGLAAQFSAQLEPLKKVGETLTQTAARLASLQTFSQSLADLGGVFGRVAGLSIDARQQLVDFAGGMESLAGLARGYVENYFNRDEIAGLKAREISDVLSGVGIDASGLSSRSDFRNLVESLDITSEQGRKQLTALLGVQGSFAGVSDYLSETGGTLGSAAAQAPEAGVLGQVFANGSAAQIDAINNVADGISQTNQLVTQLIETVKSGGSSAVDRWQQEVWSGGGA